MLTTACFQVETVAEGRPWHPKKNKLNVTSDEKMCSLCNHERHNQGDHDQCLCMLLCCAHFFVTHQELGQNCRWMRLQSRQRSLGSLETRRASVTKFSTVPTTGTAEKEGSLRVPNWRFEKGRARQESISRSEFTLGKSSDRKTRN